MLQPNRPHEHPPFDVTIMDLFLAALPPCGKYARGDALPCGASEPASGLVVNGEPSLARCRFRIDEPGLVRCSFVTSSRFGCPSRRLVCLEQHWPYRLDVACGKRPIRPALTDLLGACVGACCRGHGFAVGIIVLVGGAKAILVCGIVTWTAASTPRSWGGARVAREDDRQAASKEQVARIRSLGVRNSLNKA